LFLEENKTFAFTLLQNQTLSCTYYHIISVFIVNDASISDVREAVVTIIATREANTFQGPSSFVPDSKTQSFAQYGTTTTTTTTPFESTVRRQ
jgi:hypothetical protein